MFVQERVKFRNAFFVTYFFFLFFFLFFILKFLNATVSNSEGNERMYQQLLLYFVSYILVSREQPLFKMRLPNTLTLIFFFIHRRRITLLQNRATVASVINSYVSSKVLGLVLDSRPINC